MTKQTYNTYRTALLTFGNEEFTDVQYNARFRMDTTLRTLEKNGLVRRVYHHEREYYTVPELVEALNGCAGEDCYGTSWDYKIDDEGRVYQDFDWYCYQMVPEE